MIHSIETEAGFSANDENLNKEIVTGQSVINDQFPENTQINFNCKDKIIFE